MLYRDRDDGPKEVVLDAYSQALHLLEEAVKIMETVGDTLIAAHISTPISLLEQRLALWIVDGA